MRSLRVMGDGYYSVDPAAYAGYANIALSQTIPGFHRDAQFRWINDRTGQPADMSSPVIGYSYNASRQQWINDSTGKPYADASGVPYEPGQLNQYGQDVLYVKKAEDEMSAFQKKGITRLAIALAAGIGGAAAAGAFAGSGAANVVADTASANIAATSGELTEITLPASAVYLPTSVAPTILSESASLLSMPVFDVAAVAPLADGLVNAVKSPAVQEAIAKGTIPPVPTGIGSSAFTKWATSTGIKYLEQQLGRALSPSEQASVEQQMAAEIRRLQGQLAQNPAAAPYMGPVDWGSLLPWLIGGGAIVAAMLLS